MLYQDLLLRLRGLRRPLLERVRKRHAKHFRSLFVVRNFMSDARQLISDMSELGMWHCVHGSVPELQWYPHGRLRDQCEHIDNQLWDMWDDLYYQCKHDCESVHRRCVCARLHGWSRRLRRNPAERLRIQC